MSRELENFKKGYKDFVKYNFKLVDELSMNNSNLLLLIYSGSCDFSKFPWIDLDNKTLAEFKALAIYIKIYKDLLPIIYPGISFELGNFIPLDKLDKLYELPPKPCKLKPTQLLQALNSIKQIAESTLQETIKSTLQETINNRTGFEIVLNFLKTCTNFLITIVTFGQKQNFFKSSTFPLEKINNILENLHNLFDHLSEDEKTVELDRPKINLGNGFALL